ncbi:hypothetical protein [Streptomyces sp. WZ-12]|uniref:hypothetical protein n=1 Tax=Streptomyces sp. WZ-12 TaxID=3030210 RepID=UPI00238142B1|nr:hypothetical protein [Streptomyces sp. WZ-12]
MLTGDGVCHLRLSGRVMQMGNLVVRKGDKINVPVPTMPLVPTWVTPVIVTLDGTGGFSAGGQVVCIPQDIENISPETVAQYNAPATLGAPSAPGSGKIKFTLAAGHKARQTNTKGNPVVVNDNSPMSYTFTPDTPAQFIPPGGTNPVADPTPVYSGQATFQLNPMPKPVNAG